MVTFILFNAKLELSLDEMYNQHHRVSGGPVYHHHDQPSPSSCRLALIMMDSNELTAMDGVSDDTT